MKTVATSCLLFAIGVGVNLTFARKGFLPLDQSIVFDGGWRLVSGLDFGSWDLPQKGPVGAAVGEPPRRSRRVGDAGRLGKATSMPTFNARR